MKKTLALQAYIKIGAVAPLSLFSFGNHYSIGDCRKLVNEQDGPDCYVLIAGTGLLCRRFVGPVVYDFSNRKYYPLLQLLRVLV